MLCQCIIFYNIVTLASGSLWNYYRDEKNDAAKEIVANQ